MKIIIYTRTQDISIYENNTRKIEEWLQNKQIKYFIIHNDELDELNFKYVEGKNIAEVIEFIEEEIEN